MWNQPGLTRRNSTGFASLSRVALSSVDCLHVLGMPHPETAIARAAELGIEPTDDLLVAVVANQAVFWFRRTASAGDFKLHRKLVCSTSKYGIGQVQGSNQTPLGLHRIAQKIGDGVPAGTVFKARKAGGHMKDGFPASSITTRILWLEGLDEGLNKGGNVDTFSRYIYIHGTGDQPSLGRPASDGCIHLSDPDLVEVYDSLPVGTLVWIGP